MRIILKCPAYAPLWQYNVLSVQSNSTFYIESVYQQHLKTKTSQWGQIKNKAVSYIFPHKWSEYNL